MANLAQIAGLYTFLLFDWEARPTRRSRVTLVGVVWIAVMTAICSIGIELSARTQVVLLGAEIVTLAPFAIVALVKVYAGDAPTERRSTLSCRWLNPLRHRLDRRRSIDGVLLGIFIYWGWDSTVTVNEETEDSDRGARARPAVLVDVILLAIYVIVVDRGAGVRAARSTCVDNADDVLSVLGERCLRLAARQDPDHRRADVGGGLDPDDDPADRAHVAVDGARAGRCPTAFGAVHPRFQTPHVSTILMGVLSIVWYVGLTIVSENILFDSIAALGLMIAFYYGLTGFACAIYYRRELLRERQELLRWSASRRCSAG